jgi:hypothetical protein
LEIKFAASVQRDRTKFVSYMVPKKATFATSASKSFTSFSPKKTFRHVTTMKPSLSLNPDASPVLLRAVRLAQVSFVQWTSMPSKFHWLENLRFNGESVVLTVSELRNPCETWGANDFKRALRLNGFVLHCKSAQRVARFGCAIGGN